MSTAVTCRMKYEFILPASFLCAVLKFHLFDKHLQQYLWWEIILFPQMILSGFREYSSFVFKLVSWICCVYDLKESRIDQMVAAQSRDCAVMITNLTPPVWLPVIGDTVNCINLLHFVFIVQQNVSNLPWWCFWILQSFGLEDENYRVIW